MTLIQNKEFFIVVWKGATCQPLNRRLVGSFEGRIKNLSKEIIEEEYFKRPSWWKRLVENE